MTDTRIPGDLGEDPTMSYRTAAPLAAGAASAPPTLSSPQWTVEPDGGTGADQGPPERARYLLRRQIGQGGMGEVWEAVQSSLGRIVAIKRVRGKFAAGPDAGASLAQFRQEAVIAGRLEHPNVAPVHDLGADETGLPLLAMKLVQGKSWDELIREDHRRLDPADFLARHLAILADVTQAVAFAHSRGIIHRDLKPSQVMVGEFGEVYLMDWGLALFIDDAAPARAGDDLAPVPLPTRETASCPCGTPCLMAPEQTELDGRRLGTWTDVYLLGGILYFLLTGQFPHSSQTARESFRLATLGNVIPPAERAPTRPIPAELATLAMEALAPLPGDRPPGARAFLARIEDYLTGSTRRREAARLLEGVRERLAAPTPGYDAFAQCLAELARSASLWPDNPDRPALEQQVLGGYAGEALRRGDLNLAEAQLSRISEGEDRRRLAAALADERGRLARRESQRRNALRLAAGLGVLLAVGSIAVSVVVDKSRRRAVEAELVAREAEGRAVRSAEVASAARGRADDLINFMMVDLRDTLAPIGHLRSLRESSQKAVEYFDSLDPAEMEASDRRGLAEALTNVATVMAEMGERERAVALHRRALELRRDLAAANIADVGALVDIVESRRHLVDMTASMGDTAAAARDGAEALADLRVLLSRHPGSEEARRELMALLNQQASLLSSLTGHDNADVLYREAGEVAAELLAAQPDERQRVIDFLQVSQNRVSFLINQRLADEAAALLGDLAARHAGFLGQFPDDAALLEHGAKIDESLGFIAYQRGEHAEGLAAHERALAAVELLIQRDPANLRYRREAARLFYESNVFLFALGDLAGLEEKLARALEMYGELEVLDPDRPDVRARKTAVLNLAGAVYANVLRQPEKGLALLSESMAIQREQLEGDTTKMNLDLYLETVVSYMSALIGQGRFEELLKVLDRELHPLIPVEGPMLEVPRIQEFLLQFDFLESRAVLELGRFERLAPILARVGRAEAFFADRGGAQAETATLAGLLQVIIAQLHLYHGDSVAAAAALDRARELTPDAMNTANTTLLTLRVRQAHHLAQGLVALAADQSEPALHAYQQATSATLDLIGLAPQLADNYGRLPEIAARRSRLLAGLGRPEEARAVLDEAMPVLERGLAINAADRVVQVGRMRWELARAELEPDIEAMRSYLSQRRELFEVAVTGDEGLGTLLCRAVFDARLGDPAKLIAWLDRIPGVGTGDLSRHHPDVQWAASELARARP